MGVLLDARRSLSSFVLLSVLIVHVFDGFIIEMTDS